MNSGKRFSFICKIVSVIVFSSSLLLIPIISFAQEGGPPCGDGDPINTGCPLDTWVIVLAFIAIAFTARHLYRKQKQSSPNLQG
jgi:hypothetical protein